MKLDELTQVAHGTRGHSGNSSGSCYRKFNIKME